MYKDCIFNCEVCGNTEEIKGEQECPPECCDRPMKRQEDLPVCNTTTTAEHSRMDDMDEPCDDGRGGRIG